MSTSESDAAEWRLALLGDGEAFARVFDRHQHRVYRHSLALVPRVEDAQDVVGITFLEAWRKRSSVRFIDESLLPWLLVTATHAAQNMSRSARRYRDLLEKVPRADPALGADVLADDGAAVQALHRLTTQHRQVITLCVIEGLSEAEAANVLDIPAGTVKSRLHRAKKALAKHFLLPSPARRPTEMSARR